MNKQSTNALKDKEQVLNEEYVLFKGKVVHISELEDKSLSYDDLKNINKTTYARLKLPQKMTDETLLRVAEEYLNQCTNTGFPFITYEDALIHTIVPELIRRLRDKSESAMKN